jgi:hypothetical protein
LKNDPTHFVSIGITLANGSESPMFTRRKPEELSKINEIDISEPITTIVALKN